MKSVLCVCLALSTMACSTGAENIPPVEAEIQIHTHGWRLNADGSLSCTFGEQMAAEGEGEELGQVHEHFVVADNYGDDRTVPNNGSRPQGSRCPYVRNGDCVVPGVKRFTWNLTGFKTTGNPDLTNLAFYGLGDSLNYHRASTAMEWPFKTGKARVNFIQDAATSFAQTEIPHRQVHNSNTFGKVRASVPDEVSIKVRFNYDALMTAARRLGINDYWSFRVYFEHVFSHELGHVAGLGHSPNAADLMYFETHAGNWSTNWLTNPEIQAIEVFTPGDWGDATVLDLDL